MSASWVSYWDIFVSILEIIGHDIHFIYMNNPDQSIYIYIASSMTLVLFHYPLEMPIHQLQFVINSTMCI